MSFFDAPWHIMILLVVVLLLFGSSRLPGAAEALGKSMHIFRKSVKEGTTPGQNVAQATVAQAGPDGQAAPAAPAAQLTSQPAGPSQQAQIDDLQRQIAELQRQNAPGAAGPAEPQQSSQQL